MVTPSKNVNSHELTWDSKICNLQFAICNFRRSRSAFTLVELLVVIAIIGILAALVTAAAQMALRKAKQTRVKVEVDQLVEALEHYKTDIGSYPPNCQIDDVVKVSGDDTRFEPNSASDLTIDESQVVSNLTNHLRQIAPDNREPRELIRRLAGDPSLAGYLQGGITASEAVVFWLGGFSPDPLYPISGEGGPSYAVVNPATSTNIPVAERRQHDLLQRNWKYDFARDRLHPRSATDNYFDESVNGGRFIEYQVNVNGQNQTRRINFWEYRPPQSTQPYLYFDTSRHQAAVLSSSGDIVAPYDPPAASPLSGNALHVHAIKRANESLSASVPIQFATPDKFQILHAGIDDAWGSEAFELMSVHGVEEAGRATDDPASYLLYPTGPFTGDVGDTIVSFSEATLEASQP